MKCYTKYFMPLGLVLLFSACSLSSMERHNPNEKHTTSTTTTYGIGGGLVPGQFSVSRTVTSEIKSKDDEVKK